MKYGNAAGFVIDLDEILWIGPRTEAAGGGYAVHLRNDRVVNVNLEQGKALTSLLTEPHDKPIVPARPKAEST